MTSRKCGDIMASGSPTITPDNFTTAFGLLVQACGQKPEYKAKKGIFLPKGRYRLEGLVQMNANLPRGFEITGAGMWYTVLYSDDGTDKDWGHPAFDLNGQSVRFSDFAMFGASQTRTGSGNQPAYSGGIRRLAEKPG